MLFESLFQNIEEKVTITESDKTLLRSFFRVKKLRKRQYLLQEGELCKDIAFVVRGALKSYTLDDKGNEHVSLFGLEGWWISDFRSFICGETALLNIDAIEETYVLLLSRAHYDTMLDQMPLMERYFRILYQNSLVTKDRRLISSHTYTAEEKYQELLRQYPFIIQRIPQHLIASYLGLTTETISRIKKKQLI
ncbi:Crp/Fnr family transcriptional regulator [Sphingobacterium psychroaquaticum]|uniref:Crp/Fnr family transcriptional regulator n=1 Tax=Sphingobacterium psychroaquaticum TaxID=561061 RepID=UPI00106B59D8|nr:Crp/Fnr family transcriptional regulator [Sphingobacterium psychroaquaticum]QBQ40782.1 Crp/Fnr family transcriptional regulator [Sphingobacterium psychroaquaticum]